MLKRVISGGQTGVDRAALDVAIELGLDHGGSCVSGRKAEDGPIADRYQLTELDSPNYAVRTRQNVLDAAATLILVRGPLTGGTSLTLRKAQQYERPYLVVDLDQPPDPASLREYLADEQIETLNIAGPRESTDPGVYQAAAAYLRLVLSPS